MASNSYKELLHFISHKMRMSHIYQPVMLMTLLENNGAASIENIAKEILIRDVSQIDYYKKITVSMPARVLGKNHGLITKSESSYILNHFDDLTEKERSDLVTECKVRLADYLKKHGESAFSHRNKSSGYISGTIRYEVLKNAKFRCELCGISADEKALEVDHIVPRNKQGSDDISNLQSLCYSCNAMKRDRDDTDFRNIGDLYSIRSSGCLFCEIPKDRVVHENELAYTICDGFPVTEHHSLVIPKRHVSSYFDLTRPEVNACNQLLEKAKTQIQKMDGTVSGFNVGINIGEDAGQTIFHSHIHLIPRRKGDMNDPKGGVRGVIPEKQKY